MSIRHRNNDEKRIKMAALSAAAKDAGAIAILMVNDARWAHADKFGEYFHLPPIEEIGVEKWGREYLSIINGVYGGSLGNCPREVWEEALCVSIKECSRRATDALPALRKRPGRHREVAGWR